MKKSITKTKKYIRFPIIRKYYKKTESRTKNIARDRQNRQRTLRPIFRSDGKPEQETARRKKTGKRDDRKGAVWCERIEENGKKGVTGKSRVKIGR